jgi:hypothetical protein
MQHFTISRISDTSKTGDGNGKFFTFMERSEYFAVVVTNPPHADVRARAFGGSDALFARSTSASLFTCIGNW